MMGINDGDEEAPDKWCDWCGGGEQTTEHLMSYCDSFAALRLEVFGQAYPQQPYDVKVSQLITFLKRAKIESLEMFDTYKDYLRSKGLDSESDQEVDEHRNQ